MASTLPSPNDNSSLCEGTESSYTPLVEVLMMVVLVLWMLVICGGNGFILLAFVRSKRLRTITNFYIAMLAISDFGLGCIIPYTIAGFADTSFLLRHIKACVFYYVTGFFFGTASIWGLAGLTFDRYLAITSPLRYTSVMTPRRYIVSGIILWTVPIVLGLLVPFVWHQDFQECPECRLELIVERDYFRYLLLPAFGLVSVAMVIMYTRILVIARKQMTRIISLEQQTTNKEDQRKTSFQKQWKLVKAGVIVFAAFYICWLPYMLTMGVIMYVDRPDEDVLLVVRLFASALGMFNSSLNPFIYTYRLPAFKYEFKRLFSKVSPLREDESINSIILERNIRTTAHI